MTLTKKQKRLITVLTSSHPISEIAERIGAAEHVIRDYAQQTGLKIRTVVAGTTTLEQRAGQISRSWFLQRKWLFAGFALLVFALYAASLNNALVSDDRVFVSHPYVLQFSYAISNIISPLRGLTYAIAYSLFGLSLPVFRGITILHHAGVVILVYCILWILHRPSTALIGALLVAVHPIFVEPVVWISGGVYPQYGFFVLLGLFLFILSLHKTSYFWWSCAAFILAIMVSIRAVFFPLVILLFIFSFSQVKKHRMPLGIFSALAVFAAFFIPMQLGERIQTLASQYYLQTGIENPFLYLPIALSNYVYLMVWPMRLSLYQTEIAPSQTIFIFQALFALVFVATLVYTYYRDKFIFFWLMFFVICLLPFLTPFRISWLVAERYAYLSAIGICAIAAYGFSFFIERFPKYREMIVGLIILLLIGLSIRSVMRTFDWKNEDTLWIATVRVSPSSHNAHNNMGDVYIRQGNYEAAAQEFSRAIEIKPDYADAYHNLANTYLKLGNRDQSRVLYEKALEANPNLWQTYLQLGGMYYDDGDIATAVSYIEKAREINPYSSDVYASFAILYLMQEDVEKAREYAGKALQINPRDDRAQAVLRQMQTGDPGQSLP